MGYDKNACVSNYTSTLAEGALISIRGNESPAFASASRDCFEIVILDCQTRIMASSEKVLVSKRVNT